MVTLAVFDVNGRRVAGLERGMRESGRYTARWDGTGCASGVYYLRLAVTNPLGITVYNKTERLLFMK